jgi:hypothetical protein
MGIETRKEIAHWFFLIIGMAGAVFFTVEFARTENYSFLEWLGITSAFSVFIFRPMVLLDVFEIIKAKLSK